MKEVSELVNDLNGTEFWKGGKGSDRQQSPVTLLYSILRSTLLLKPGF